MRILITGYTTRMFGSKRIQGDYITFSFLLEDILKEMGHTVERRKVTIGEQIVYVYDYAFCGVAPLSSMTSGHIPETHYVMRCLPGRHAVYADDWSFCSYGNSIRYALKSWEKYLEYKKFPYEAKTLFRTRESLEYMVSMAVAGNNAPILAPMFKWGDHNFLLRENYIARLITVDPSAWVKYPTLTVIPKRQRKTEWVMAALSDHSRWIKRNEFSFPVRTVGNKRMGDGIVLRESEAVKLFSSSFGILSAGYPSAGSGWWRTRYLNAAWAETLVYCDPKDQVTMGEGYQGTAHDFESTLHLPSYDERVVAQHEWLDKNLMTKEEVISIVEGLIKK